MPCPARQGNTEPAKGNEHMNTGKGAWFAALLLLGLLSVGAPESMAQGAGGMNVTVTEYGEYEDAGQGTGVRDYGIECPQLDVALVRRTEVIEAAPMVRFGFEFVLQGGREGELTPLKARVRKPLAYGPRNEETWDILVCAGRPAFVGWRFARDRGIEAGVWVLELLDQGEVLASRPFDVQPVAGFGRAAPLAEDAVGPGELRTRIGPAAPAGGHLGPATWALARSATGICVQVSACLIPENAENDVARLKAKGYPAYLEVVEDPARGRTWHTVRLGDFPHRAEAERAALEFSVLENRPSFVVVK